MCKFYCTLMPFNASIVILLWQCGKIRLEWTQWGTLFNWVLYTIDDLEKMCQTSFWLPEKSDKLLTVYSCQFVNIWLTVNKTKKVVNKAVVKLWWNKSFTKNSSFAEDCFLTVSPSCKLDLFWCYSMQCNLEFPQLVTSYMGYCLVYLLFLTGLRNNLVRKITLISHRIYGL